MAVKVVYRTVHRKCDSGNPVIDSLCMDLLMDVYEYVTNALMPIDECEASLETVICRVEDDEQYRRVSNDIWEAIDGLSEYVERRFGELLSKYRVLGRFYDLSADFYLLSMFVSESRVTNYVYRIDVRVDQLDVEEGIAVDIGVWLTVIYFDKPIDFERLLLEMELDRDLELDMLWLFTYGEEASENLNIELALAA